MVKETITAVLRLLIPKELLKNKMGAGSRRIYVGSLHLIKFIAMYRNLIKLEDTP